MKSKPRLFWADPYPHWYCDAHGWRYRIDSEKDVTVFDEHMKVIHYIGFASEIHFLREVLIDTETFPNLIRCDAPPELRQ